MDKPQYEGDTEPILDLLSNADRHENPNSGIVEHIWKVRYWVKEFNRFKQSSKKTEAWFFVLDECSNLEIHLAGSRNWRKAQENGEV